MSTLLLGTVLTVLPLVAAGLLAAMVLLERQADAQLGPAPAYAGRGRAAARSRQRRRGRRRV
jgi:hypothetical protein